MVSWGMVTMWLALDLSVESDLQNGQKSMVSTGLRLLPSIKTQNIKHN
jgi:hypothetical protein